MCIEGGGMFITAHETVYYSVTGSEEANLRRRVALAASAHIYRVSGPIRVLALLSVHP
jgi:hypothetical protein